MYHNECYLLVSLMFLLVKYILISRSYYVYIMLNLFSS